MQPRTLLLVLLLATFGMAAPARSQTPPPMPSPEQLERMMEAARMMMNPAAQLLARRAEVNLTGEQVARIEPIAARTAGVVEGVMAWQRELPHRSVTQRAMTDHEMEFDEAAIRAEARESADVQAELTIAMLRSMREIREVLTPTQLDAWMQIQMNESLRMMQGMMPRP
jgi:Spy/CpxP family protein refolding chaperone